MVDIKIFKTNLTLKGCVLGYSALVVLMKQAVRSFETSANFDQIIRRYNPEEIYFYTSRSENLKSCMNTFPHRNPDGYQISDETHYLHFHDGN